MKDLVEEFDAESEDGQVFRIHVYGERIDTGTLENPGASSRGLKEARTFPENMACNYVDDDTFEIVQLGIKVKRV